MLQLGASYGSLFIAVNKKFKYANANFTGSFDKVMLFHVKMNSHKCSAAGTKRMSGIKTKKESYFVHTQNNITIQILTNKDKCIIKCEQ
jgi:hypothetical protein